MRIAKAITVLEKMFEDANEVFYGGELETPVITVSPDGKGSTYGWCTTWRAWSDGQEGRYELNITAEHLNRPIENIVGTMLHEMVHLYHLAHGIQGTSRGGTYHNKKFKADAEARGLNIGKHDKYGWTITTLNFDGEEFVVKMGYSDFGFSRLAESQVAEKTKKKSSSRKYICPECGQSIRATKEVNIICGDCDVNGGATMKDIVVVIGNDLKDGNGKYHHFPLGAVVEIVEHDERDNSFYCKDSLDLHQWVVGDDLFILRQEEE